MASADEWGEIVARVRAEGGLRSPNIRRLYEIAIADGRAMIRSFRGELGDAQVTDLVCDFLAEKLDAIVAADTPKAFFRAALIRRAISWRRRGDAAVMEDPPAESPDAEVVDGSEGDKQAFLLDARAALMRLPERDREIVVAAALGADRDELAAAFATSRANIDQIVSRAQRRFHGAKS